MDEEEQGGLLEETDRSGLERMEHNARQLQDRGVLREGVTLEELYELLVLRRGWSLGRYAEFAAEGMMAALLPAGQG